MAPATGSHRHLAGVLALALGTLFTYPAQADSSDFCITAAQDAAAASDVPMSVLLAITQTETGRTEDDQVRPWPWTVNMEGEGHWFDTREEALAFATAKYDRGARSFDIGCFQVNYRWHGENFVSIEQMFDPVANATYAAGFLSDLRAETGDWSLAAGAYHSRTEEYATRYRARFDDLRSAAVTAGADNGSYVIGNEGAFAVATLGQGRDLSGQPRQNSFPLLQLSDGARTLGSLVPISDGG